MTLFEMTKYHKQSYPPDIPLRIEEVAAHFDITNIEVLMPASLHTEYSYGRRAFNSNLISQFPVLVESQNGGIPQLWKNKKWALSFAQFVSCLVVGKCDPAVIEIHPPFSDYTNIENFVEVYSVFEQAILSAFPKAEILIENRCGSIYRGGKFIISKIGDIEKLCGFIDARNLQLKIAYDIPQLFTAHNIQNPNMYIQLIEMVKPLRKHIGGVHLWGKKKSLTGRKVAHCGDLDSYFEDNNAVKHAFLAAFADCFDDNTARKMVLEVNSGNSDMLSIIDDLKRAKICFV